LTSPFKLLKSVANSVIANGQIIIVIIVIVVVIASISEHLYSSSGSCVSIVPHYKVNTRTFQKSTTEEKLYNYSTDWI